MNPAFQRLIGEATRLTQAGDLHAATAVIQSALGGAAAPPAAPARAAPPAAADAAAWIIDVDAREVPDAVDPPGAVDPPDAARPQRGVFVAGSYALAGAGARDYKLHLPPASATGVPLPLVVMLHGCTQDPDDFAAGTRMNEAADERGFVVLYPAQAAKANSSRCWNWFKHNHQQRGRGEPALLAGMTRDVMQRHAIDPQRVYVAGLSAGGAMAAILGQAYPELYAAIGVHSGLPVGAARDVKTAFEAMQGSPSAAAGSRAGVMPPTIVFHGDRDATVHPVNGERIVAAAHGSATPAAEEERARSNNGRPYTRRSYRDATGRVVAEHWLVHGAGHAWSGGDAGGSYTDAEGPDATMAMLRFFFAQHGSSPSAA